MLYHLPGHRCTYTHTLLVCRKGIVWRSRGSGGTHICRVSIIWLCYGYQVNTRGWKPSHYKRLNLTAAGLWIWTPSYHPQLAPLRTANGRNSGKRQPQNACREPWIYSTLDHLHTHTTWSYLSKPSWRSAVICTCTADLSQSVMRHDRGLYLLDSVSSEAGSLQQMLSHDFWTAGERICAKNDSVRFRTGCESYCWVTALGPCCCPQLSGAEWGDRKASLIWHGRCPYSSDLQCDAAIPFHTFRRSLNTANVAH